MEQKTTKEETTQKECFVSGAVIGAVIGVVVGGAVGAALGGSIGATVGTLTCKDGDDNCKECEIE